MKQIVRSIINKIILPIGFSLEKTHDVKTLREKYQESITELHNAFQEVLLPGFPLVKGRLSLLSNLSGTQVSEALYILFYLHKTMHITGDVCEFGVANGATSALLVNEINNTKKILWLFDSFQGLSKPTAKDVLVDDIFQLGSMAKYQGTMRYAVSDVKRRLKQVKVPKSRTQIVSGFIEDIVVSGDQLPAKVSFAYIDFDLYNPIKTALQLLETRLAKGAYVIVDDYGFFSQGAKKAVDEFIKETQKRYVLTLPYKFAGHFCLIQKLK